jgi:hypothetical protein
VACIKATINQRFEGSLRVRSFKSANLGLSLFFRPREQHCEMWVAKRTRLCVTLVLVVGLAALILGCEPASKQSSPVVQVAQDEATQKTTAKAPPIPEAGPLARPKSLQQVGVPDGATRTAIPTDNPQAPEKIDLGPEAVLRRSPVG